MSRLKELLVEEMQDLLHAEKQLVAALPKMAEAAHHPKVKEAFSKHLAQTQNHVERLNQAFELLGAPAEAKACRGMQGLIEEGKEQIEEGKTKDELSADLSLVCSAQKVEHYEISGYGTARTLALMINEHEVARLMSMTLGEEESADYLLTEVTKPILQEAMGEEFSSRKTSAGERTQAHEPKPKVRKAS